MAKKPLQLLTTNPEPTKSKKSNMYENMFSGMDKRQEGHCNGSPALRDEICSSRSVTSVAATIN